MHMTAAIVFMSSIHCNVFLIRWGFKSIFYSARKSNKSLTKLSQTFRWLEVNWSTFEEAHEFVKRSIATYLLVMTPCKYLCPNSISALFHLNKQRAILAYDRKIAFGDCFSLMPHFYWNRNLISFRTSYSVCVEQILGSFSFFSFIHLFIRAITVFAPTLSTWK